MVVPTSLAGLRHYWSHQVVGSVDHVEVNERVHDDAGLTARFLTMTTLSAAIAVLGLLLSSPAVVIGAMLISPLMGPIIGLGFALATVDARQIRRAAAALVAGSLLAVAFTAAIVLVSPLRNVTAEIAARTHPNLFDLLVALFAAIAGAYSTIRGRAGTIVGVAIATALMPPLATVGFGVATGSAPVALGALLLFVTNFVTIAIAATVMARLYGFGSTLSPQQTALQLVLVTVTVAALAAPLALALRQLAWEGTAAKTARQEVEGLFGDQARVSQVDIDLHAHPIEVTATVLTPHPDAGAERRAGAALTRELHRPVHVAIRQFRVGTEAGDAEAAAIEAAHHQADADDAGAAAEAVAARVATLAGVARGAVLVDRVAHRLRAAMAPLPGAGLATYRALEQRAAQPGWTVELVPPAAPPPVVPVAADGPDSAALDLAAWGAQRLGYGVTVAAGPHQAAAVIAALAARGVAATRGPGLGPRGGAALAWAVAPPPQGPKAAPAG